MITVLEGKESYQLNAKKKQLIKNSKADGENIIVIDASSRSSFSMESALNLCSTISLFGDRRVVLLTNPYFLKSGTASSAKSTKSKKGKTASSADLLDEYCVSPNPDTDLIFLCDGYLCDKRTKEYKVLSAHAGKTVTFITFSNPSPWEMDQLIERELNARHFHLTNDALAELKLRITDSATEFYRTLEKMELYGGTKFDRAAIAGLVSYNPEVNVWKLSDAFIKGNAASTLETWYELREHASMDVYGILPTLSYRLKRLYCVRKCYEMGMGFAEIKDRTGQGFPEKDLDSCAGHDSAWFIHRLKELAELDQNMKTGLVNGTEALEMFLLRNLRHG